MLISRTVSRFIARLLIGVLVFAQVALAAYACPPVPTATMSVPENGGTMGADRVAAKSIHAMPDESRPMDGAQLDLCAGHCQSSQQIADVKPVPAPPFGLLAGYFTLNPVAQVVGRARLGGPTQSPPPHADPPHAILHCCLRL